MAACHGRATDKAPPADGDQLGDRRPQPSAGHVRTEMKGVDLLVDPKVVLEVRELHGELLSNKEGVPPFFDDPNSFRVKIDEGEVAMTPESLSALLNGYVFNDASAPVEDVKIEIENGHIKQSATLKKKIRVHTTIEGDLSVTPEGDIRLHPTKIKADGLPVKGLLDLFDVELSEMIKSQESKGVRIVENDFILDPEKLGPSPRMLGRVVAVRLEKDHLVQIFGGAKATPLKPSFPNAAHYIFFRGGELSFGKLTMHGADLQIIDQDPKDALLMSPNHFDRQLVAGFSRTLPDKGLATFVPDYNEIGN